MSIATEKREIRENSDSLTWLLHTYGGYYREEAELIRLAGRYSYKTELGKAIVKRKRAAQELKEYVHKLINKHHAKEDS